MPDESKGPDPKLVAELAVAMARDHVSKPVADPDTLRTLLDMPPSIIEEMRKTRMEADALVAEIRRHLAMSARAILHHLRITANEARHCLRVEVTPDAEQAIMSSSTGPLQFYRDPTRPAGPWSLDGVDIYVVRELPPQANGWRVVNPFERR